MAILRDVVREESASELKARLDGGEDLVLIDIRDPEDFRRGRIASAVNIVKKQLVHEIGGTVPRLDTPIVLYCPAGPGSLKTGAALIELGFTDVTSLAGGFDGWVKAGLPIVSDSVFTAEQSQRYSRHFLLPEVGEAGQLKLLGSKVLLIGAGGLGSPVGLYLAATGVGTLGIVDGDHLDVSNLQRQVLHRTADVGRPKVASATDTIKALNPDVTVVPYETRIDVDNAIDIIHDYDLVIDGSDNFATRYLVNDACYLAGKPHLHGSIYKYQGIVTMFAPDQGICYRCLHPMPPPAHMVPTWSEVGVLGVLPGVIGLIEATEAIKFLLGWGHSLVGRLLTYDAVTMKFREMPLSRNPKCPLTGANPTIKDLEIHRELAAAGGACAVRPS